MMTLQLDPALRFSWIVGVIPRCYRSFGDVSPVERYLMEAVLPETPFAIEAIQKYSFFWSSHSFHKQLAAHKHLHG